LLTTFLPDDYFVFTDTLTEAQLLALVLPSINYIAPRKKSKSTTDPSFARTPHSVLKWDGFIRNANGIAVDDTTPRYNLHGLEEESVHWMPFQIL